MILHSLVEREFNAHIVTYASFRRLADKLRISLCLTVGKPPLWDIMARSTVTDASYMHNWERLEGCHPYLKQRTSQNAKFFLEQNTTVNDKSTAGRFDPKVFVNCVQDKECSERWLLIYKKGDRNYTIPVWPM